MPRMRREVVTFARGNDPSARIDVVKRHELLDAIQKASDTGIRQIP